MLPPAKMDLYYIWLLLTHFYMTDRGGWAVLVVMFQIQVETDA